MNALSHLNNQGEAQMVDVSHKTNTVRIARAEGFVIFPPTIQSALAATNWNTAKGSVLETARIAGTMAAKQTSQLIPLCHPLPIHSIQFETHLLEGKVQVICEVKTEGKTGVEMEALTGVSVACLTVYDMCKALGHEIEISGIRILKKEGGKHKFERE